MYDPRKKTSPSAGRLVGQQQLCSTPHAIEILSTPMASRTAMVHCMRPAWKPFSYGAQVSTTPVLRPPRMGSPAPQPRAGRLSGGFNGGINESYLPPSIDELLTWYPYWTTLHALAKERLTGRLPTYGTCLRAARHKAGRGIGP